MPDEKDVKVQLEPEEADTSQEKVEIAPTPAKLSEEDQLAAKIKSDFESLYGSRLKQTEDRLHGAYRINEKLQKEMEQLKARVDQVKPASTNLSAQASTSDPWAGIENGSTWKAEIEKLAQSKAEELLKQREEQQRLLQQTQLHQSALESSKQQVVGKYPDLDPESGTADSPVSKAYTAVLTEHPDWLTNPYGPLLAMYAMEEKLKANSAARPSPSGGAGSRTAAASLAPSRPAASGGERFTLTREQKAFCDRHGLKYEDYIKTAAAVEEGAIAP